MNIATAIPMPPSLCRSRVSGTAYAGAAPRNAPWNEVDALDRRKGEGGGTGILPVTKSGDERAGVVLGVERAEVVHALAHADELHGQPELDGDRDRDARRARCRRASSARLR